MRRGLVLVAGTIIFLAGAVQVAAAAEPELNADAVTVDEDVKSGEAVVTVRLDRDAKKRTTIEWKTVSDSATRADYVADEGAVTIPVGDRSRKVAVALRNDAMDEPTERFFVKLSSDDARIPDERVPVRISDDDPLPTLTGAWRTLTEGARDTTKPATLTLSLSRRSGRTVKVDWGVGNGTATAGVDATGKGTATIPAGATSTTLPARIVGDNVAEGDEAAPVLLSSPDNARIARHGRITIDDDDDPATSTDLYVKLDSARAESQAFTTTADDGVTLLGGVIEATAANGTLYRLTIPDGALFKPVTITMTPWADLEGMNVVGGALAGVDLKPNGLQLLDTATLEIIPVGGGDVPAVSFAYVGGGREAHQYPLALDITKLEMGITHFSGYGAYAGEGTSMPVVPHAPPADPGQALADEIARLLAEERQRQLDGEAPNDEIWDTIADYMQSYYNNVVLPLLGGIREDCAQAKANNGKVLGWARNAQLLFGETRFAAETDNVLDAVTDGAENCLEEAMEPCVDPDDAAQQAEIYRHWRTVELLGGTVPDPPPNDPVWECEEVLLGSVTYQFDLVTLAGDGPDYSHEEHRTVQFQPRLVEASPGYWMDDGLGGWSLTGSYDFEDLRPDVECGNWEEVYSGSGVFNTDMFANESQLSPDTDEGLGNFKIEGFFSAGSFGATPTVRGEVVGHEVRTDRYASDDTCVEDTDESGHWVPIAPCPTNSGGAVGEEVTDPIKGRGVTFSCTRSLNSTSDNLQKTGTVKINGEFWLTQA